MKKLNRKIFLACGLLLTLAAFPVFAQQAKENNIELNKRPLKDFAEEISRKTADGKVDLTKPFSVEFEGTLKKDGKIDKQTAKFTKNSGDKEMIDVGRAAIEAINDSGYFQYLSNLGVEKINIALAQDEKQVSANIKSEMPTAERARAISSVLNMLISMSKIQKQNQNDDEKFWLNSFTTAAVDKSFIISFAAPRETVHALLEKRLAAETQKNSGK